MNVSDSALRLYDDFFERITGGSLAEGAYLPSEKELAEQYGISRMTVRKVLQKLCDKKLIEKLPGKGSVVSRQESKISRKSALILGIDYNMPAAHYYSIIYHTLSNSGNGEIYLNLQNRSDLEKGFLHGSMDALLLTRGELPEQVCRKIIAQNIPVLCFNRQVEQEGVAYVSIDHTAESVRAVNYLFSTGCKRIALIGESGNLDDIIIKRCQGWKNSYMKNAGNYPADLQLKYDDLFLSGRAEEFIRHTDFDGLFFVNLISYQLFMKEFVRFAGNEAYSMPSMVFDDMEPAVPAETLCCNYVKMPLARMSELSIAYFRSRHENPDTPVIRQILPCSLVINQ